MIRRKNRKRKKEHIEENNSSSNSSTGSGDSTLKNYSQYEIGLLHNTNDYMNATITKMLTDMICDGEYNWKIEIRVKNKSNTKFRLITLILIQFV